MLERESLGKHIDAAYASLPLNAAAHGRLAQLASALP